MKNRYFYRSRLTEVKFRKIIKYFANDLLLIRDRSKQKDTCYNCKIN